MALSPLTDDDRTGGLLSQVHNCRKLWYEAANNAIKEAQSYLKNGKDVFFLFHGIYYADKYSDFYSPIDIFVAQHFPSPKRFINLIDDIGDVAVRLRAAGQVFSFREKEELESVNEALLDLLTVLEWRSHELVVSRLLGGLVGKEPIVLAVKHPIKTAARILLDQGKLAYVSHTISEARDHYQKHSEWPPFMAEVQRFSDELARSSEVIPILPTTIDELRIQKDDENYLVPTCLARWALPAGESLVRPVHPDNWLDPRSHFMDHEKTGRPKKHHGKRNKIGLEPLQGLLGALHNRIGNQVNARDHLLVGQCPVLVAYRPYRSAWRMTDGVTKEIEHADRLRDQGTEGRKIIIVSPDGDDRYRKLGIIRANAAVLLRWARGPVAVTPEEIKSILGAELDQNNPISFDKNNIAEKVEEILREKGIELSIKGRDNLLGRETAWDIQNHINGVWKTIEESISEPDGYKNKVEVWIADDLSPEALAQKIAETVVGFSNEARD